MCLLYMLLFQVMPRALCRLEVAVLSAVHSHEGPCFYFYFITSPRKSVNHF